MLSIDYLDQLLGQSNSSKILMGINAIGCLGIMAILKELEPNYVTLSIQYGFILLLDSQRFQYPFESQYDALMMALIGGLNAIGYFTLFAALRKIDLLVIMLVFNFKQLIGYSIVKLKKQIFLSFYFQVQHQFFSNLTKCQNSLSFINLSILSQETEPFYQCQTHQSEKFNVYNMSIKLANQIFIIIMQFQLKKRINEITLASQFLIIKAFLMRQDELKELGIKYQSKGIQPTCRNFSKKKARYALNMKGQYLSHLSSLVLTSEQLLQVIRPKVFRIQRRAFKNVIINAILF